MEKRQKKQLTEKYMHNKMTQTIASNKMYSAHSSKTARLTTPTRKNITNNIIVKIYCIDSFISLFLRFYLHVICLHTKTIICYLVV